MTDQEKSLELSKIQQNKIFPQIQNDIESQKNILEGGENIEKKIGSEIFEQNEVTPDLKEVKKEDTKISEKDQKDKEKEEKEKAEKEAHKKKVQEEANRLLRKYMGNIKCLMFVGFILSVLGLVGQLLTPLFIGWVTDAIVAKNFEYVKVLMIYWSIVMISTIFAGLQKYIFEQITQRVGQNMRQDLFERIMEMDVEFFDSRKTGDLISRLQSDITKIEMAVSSQFALMLSSGLYMLITLGLLFYISVYMTLFTLGVMLPSFIFGPSYGRFMREVNKNISDAKAKASEVTEEAFSNVRTVKAFATEDHETMHYLSQNNNIFKYTSQAARAYGVFQCVTTLIMFGSLDALVFFAAYLNRNQMLSIGNFSSFQFYMFSFLINFLNLASVIGDLMGLSGTMASIAEIFLHKPSINIDHGDKVTQESIQDGSITLSDIKFTYPTKRDIQVIKNLSLKVEKNKTVALVGTSGCGKSTIIQLVERFYDPNAGSIQYGLQDLKDLNPESYKENMAIVQQEPILFSGTIRENIIYGLSYQPSDEQLDEACNQANALAFVKDTSLFPQGYDTLVGERGVKLSGGQKQRVAIARALIRKPKILLLDEATSALDAESEHQVQQALDGVLENDQLSQTVIVIAHRLSTIKNADEIIVLKKGEIVERGNHNQLIQMNGVYKALVQRQLMKADGMQ